MSVHIDNITRDNKKLGEGSFGAVYALDESRAIKIHIIDDDIEESISSDEAAIQLFCDSNWRHEFDMQNGIFACINPKIKTFWGHIVQPLKYQYVTRQFKAVGQPDSILQPNADCRIVMERIVSGDSAQFKQIYNKKIKKLIKPEFISSVFTSSVPYIYFGGTSDQPETNGHIALDKLIGSTEYKLTNTVSYYDVDADISFKLITGMFNTFLTFITCNYMPRDIEYVFNCKKYDGQKTTYFSVLDFNQVSTLDEREEKAKKPYNLARDTAQVYIDLCGIRKADSRNPYYFGDTPTPQWKFLCNPFVTPKVFLSICKNLLLCHMNSELKKHTCPLPIEFGFKIEFIDEIIKYIHDNYLDQNYFTYNWIGGYKFFDKVAFDNDVFFLPKYDSADDDDESESGSQASDEDSEDDDSAIIAKTDAIRLLLKKLDNLLQKYFLDRVCHSINAKLQPNGIMHDQVLHIIDVADDFDDAIHKIVTLDKSLAVVADSSDSLFGDDIFFGDEEGGFSQKRKSRTKRHVYKSRSKKSHRTK
jgi:hypothetical protein